MISVQHLSKLFKTAKTEPGVGGFIKSILNRQYKETLAVADISFNIKQGELVGFLGPNGAGKTTTLKMLAGILYPSSGSIDVLGFTPFEKNPEYLKQIAFIMGQRNQLLWELPAMDTFKLNQVIYGVSDAEFKKNVTELADMLSAHSFLDQPVKTLSLGQRMKAELISALLHNPKVLFLDEPTIGLDVIAQKTMRDFIAEYQKHHDATILLTSHYMEDVKRLAKRVVIIDRGSLLYDGLLENLISKYASEKVVEIIVEDMPKTDDLKKISYQMEVMFPKIIFRAPRKDVPKLVQDITNNISFVDINIEEEKIEDIVRRIFKESDAEHEL